MNRKRHTGGFTLVELMIVVAILAILLGIIYAVFSSMYRSTALLEAKIRMRDEARTAMQFMTSNLSMAALNNHTFDVDPAAPEYLDSALKLHYEVNDVDIAWPPPLDDAADFYTRPVDTIEFIRPIAGPDGLPFSPVNTSFINWSDVIRYSVIPSVDGDGNATGDFELVQFVNGVQTRTLATNIAPVGDNGVGEFAVPAVGGFFVQSEAGDDSRLRIVIIQRMDLGWGSQPTVWSRYDGYVDVRN